MLKKLAKTAIVVSSAVLGAASAHADSAKLKEYTYDVKSAWTTLHVTSSDGQKWDDLKPGKLLFWAHMKIDTKWPGVVEDVAVVLGNCSGSACRSFPLIWSNNPYQRDYNDQRNMAVHTSLLTGNNAGLTLERQNIIEKCNAGLTNGGATKAHEFEHSLKTTFVTDTGKAWGKIIKEAAAFGLNYPSEINHAKTGEFTFNVVCDAHVPRVTADELKLEHGEFKTTDMDLFLSTFSNATTSPNPATTCKKGRVLVRVRTSKAGPAKFRLWTKVGNGAMTSKVVDAWSSHDGNGGFKAEHKEWIPVDKPTQVLAMAEDMVNSIGQATQWKDIMLPCTGKGGGGFTTGANDEPQLPGRTLTGDFAYVDHGSPKCSRMGKALISFKSNRPDNIHYSLDCANGQHLSGYVKPVKAPQGGYVAAAIKSFGIDKTTVYSCALKTVQPGPVTLHKWKSHTFNCVQRAVETGSNDIQVDPKPSDDAPNRSPANLVKTAPAPDPANDAAKRDRLTAKKRADEARRTARAEKRRKARIAAQQAAKEKRQRDAAIKARKRKLEAAAAKRAERVAAQARQKAKAEEKARIARRRAAALKRRTAATNSSAPARVIRRR